MVALFWGTALVLSDPVFWLALHSEWHGGLGIVHSSGPLLLTFCSGLSGLLAAVLYVGVVFKASAR